VSIDLRGARRDLLVASCRIVSAGAPAPRSIDRVAAYCLAHERPRMLGAAAPIARGQHLRASESSAPSSPSALQSEPGLPSRNHDEGVRPDDPRDPAPASPTVRRCSCVLLRGRGLSLSSQARSRTWATRYPRAATPAESSRSLRSSPRPMDRRLGRHRARWSQRAMAPRARLPGLTFGGGRGRARGRRRDRRRGRHRGRGSTWASPRRRASPSD
jgi:hypothetical protein